MNARDTKIDSDVKPGSVSDAVVSHPVGTGVGALLGGAAAGAAAGTVAGPVGTVVGAVAGAIVGGMAGNEVAKAIDPKVEDAYWRENYKDRPYAEDDKSYEEYAPAYRYGVDSFSQNPGRNFDEAEPELGRDWGSTRGNSSLDWDKAKHATRDAWTRLSDTVERATPGDSDRDGK